MQKAPAAQTRGIPNCQTHTITAAARKRKKENVVAGGGEDGRTVSNWMLCQAFPFRKRKGEALSGAALRTIALAFLSFSKSPRCSRRFGLTSGELNAIAPRMALVEEVALSPVLPDSSENIHILLPQSMSLREEKLSERFAPCLRLADCTFLVADHRPVVSVFTADFGDRRLCCQAALFPLRACLLSQPRFPEEADGVSAGGA